MFKAFGEFFSKKLQKVPHLVKKHKRSSIRPKGYTISNKPPCFGVLVNFSAKCCKECLISWKSTEHGRFGQKLATFRTEYHVSLFSRTFRQKVPQLVKKHEKSSIWLKGFNFFNKLQLLRVFVSFLLKSCQECLIS